MGNVLPLAVEMTLEIDVPPQKAGGQPTPYRVVRVIPLACAKPATDAGTTGGIQ
jgi:hypothetical protein